MATKKEMNVTADPMYKGKLQAACAELESGLPNLQFSFLSDYLHIPSVAGESMLCVKARIGLNSLKGKKKSCCLFDVFVFAVGFFSFTHDKRYLVSLISLFVSKSYMNLLICTLT